MNSLAEKYSGFSSVLEWEKLPSEVSHFVVDLFADWLGCAVAGYSQTVPSVLAEMISCSGNEDSCIILGSLESSHPLSAALVNAASAHALEYDDTYRAGLFHPGAPIISAAFAAGYYNGVSSRDMLAGIVAGYEVSMRIAEAINPSHYNIWHTTGTVGTLGAVIAACRCFGLNDDQTANAMGIAGTQASGLWEILPNAPEIKSLHPAKAAHAGLMAALLAKSKLNGPKTILEGNRGLFKAMVPDTINQGQCLKDLNKDWYITQTTLKAYPVCGHTMTAIEAALALRDKFSIESIKKIEVQVHPVSVKIADNPDPQSPQQAKFSIQYCTALSLIQGRVSLSDFSYETMQNIQLRKLLSCISVVPSESLINTDSKRPVKMIITDRENQTYSSYNDLRRGDPEMPLTPQDKRHKFIDLVKGVWGKQSAEAVYLSIKGLPESESIQSWMKNILRSQNLKSKSSVKPVIKKQF